jgi:hypothetical protein
MCTPQGTHQKTEVRKMRGTVKNSGCVGKGVYSGLMARRKADTAEYIIHEGKRYEYRCDTQIFRHDATKLTRIKKAEWLAIKAQHGEDK